MPAIGDEILKCPHFDIEGPFDNTEIPEDLYHEIDWQLHSKHQQSMYLPLKAESAVGDSRFLVRRVSAMNWPTFCALFGERHTAEELNKAWLTFPIVRTAHHRGTAPSHGRYAGGRWRQKGGKKGGKGGGKGSRKGDGKGGGKGAGTQSEAAELGASSKSPPSRRYQ